MTKAKQLRIKRGVRIEDVASACGVSFATIARIERGGDASLTTLRKVAAYYGVGFDDVAELIHSPLPPPAAPDAAAISEAA